MVDFQTEEQKQVEAKYNALRRLLATIGAGDKPMRAVKPQLLVTSTGTEGTPEVTAALVVALERGDDVLEALTNLESALRIATYGVHANEVREDPLLVSVDVPPLEDAPTLVNLVAGHDDDAGSGRQLN